MSTWLSSWLGWGSGVSEVEREPEIDEVTQMRINGYSRHMRESMALVGGLLMALCSRGHRLLSSLLSQRETLQRELNELLYGGGMQYTFAIRGATDSAPGIVPRAGDAVHWRMAHTDGSQQAIESDQSISRPAIDLVLGHACDFDIMTAKTLHDGELPPTSSTSSSSSSASAPPNLPQDQTPFDPSILESLPTEHQAPTHHDIQDLWIDGHLTMASMPSPRICKTMAHRALELLELANGNELLLFKAIKAVFPTIYPLVVEQMFLHRQMRVYGTAADDGANDYTLLNVSFPWDAESLTKNHPRIWDVIKLLGSLEVCGYTVGRRLCYVLTISKTSMCVYAAISQRHLVLLGDDRKVLRNSDGSLQLMEFELHSQMELYLRVRMTLSVFWEVALPEFNLRVQYTGQEIELPDGRGSETAVSFRFSFDSIGPSSLDWFLSWFVPVERARYLICKHFSYSLRCVPAHMFTLVPLDPEYRGNLLDVRYHVRLPMISSSLMRLMRMFSHDLMLGDIMRLGVDLTNAVYTDLRTFIAEEGSAPLPAAAELK